MRGIMGKAMRGLGVGMAQVGEMGLQAALLEKRDAKLAEYDNARQDKQLGAQREMGLMQEAGAKERTQMQEAGADRRLDKQMSAKDNKPTVLPPGSKLIGADGSILAENNTNEDKNVVVPEGANLVNPQGKLLHSNPKDRSREQADDVRKDLDAMRALAKSRMGEGFLEKFSDTERQEFDRVFTEGARKVRKGVPLEEAYDQSIKEFQRWQAQQKVGGGKPSGSKAQSIRDKYGF